HPAHALGDDPQHAGHLSLHRLGVRTPVQVLELATPPPLASGHRTAATQLRVREPADEVRVLAHHPVELGRAVLAPLERAEAVEAERLGELGLPAEPFVEELAVAPQALGHRHDGLGRAAVLAGELAEAATVGQRVERLREELRALEPVVGAKGLGRAVAPAVLTAETLDALGGAPASEAAGAYP